MKIAMVQLNPIIGDVEGNFQKLRDAILAAESNKMDLVVASELYLTGYPPRDLLDRRDLISLNIAAKDQIVQITKGLHATVVFGYAQPTIGDGQKPLYNGLCVCRDGAVIQQRYKTLLPTYDVFSEARYFQEGPPIFESVMVAGLPVGFVNCEEIWNDSLFWKKHLYKVNPVAEMVKNGAMHIVAINASPYRRGVVEQRRNMVIDHCHKHHVGFTYVNQVGYNDDIGFDGNSFAVNETGQIIAHSLPFKEDITYFNTDDSPLPPHTYEVPWEQEILNALTLGVTDYFKKTGITGPAIIGLSGGIDSALVAFIASIALGKERVIGIGMPSQFSSEGSVTDAEKIAKRLGIHFAVQPIVVTHADARTAIDCINHFLTGGDINGGGPPNPHLFGKKITLCADSGVTDENIQARIRGMYLMALSNYYNGLVLSTGNKSEMAVGYCTMYGDMCGGLAVISDVPKTDVFRLCNWINEHFRSEIIPYATINKPPSAELRAGQTDQQTLPPYSTLDAVLFRYVDEGKTPDEIITEMVTEDNRIKYANETTRDLERDIRWVCRAVDLNEYKRKQAPTGLKTSAKLFKFGWERPIAHKFITPLMKVPYGNV